MSIIGIKHINSLADDGCSYIRWHEMCILQQHMKSFVNLKKRSLVWGNN